MLFEAAALLLGIVEFAEAVRDFHTSGVDFPALRPVRLVGLDLGEGGDGDRELVDNRWLDQMLLCRRPEKIGDGLARGFIWVVGDVRVASVEALDQSSHRIMGAEFAELGFGARRFRPVVNDRLAHGHTPPVHSRPVNLVLAPFGSCPRSYVNGHPLDQLLGQVHHPAVIGIGLVKLEHGELGVVPGRDALVAKIAIDLVDPIESPDQQPLEIQLRRDAQKKVNVERVMMGHERPRHSAAGNRLHHGRFHFDEFMRVHEAPHGLHQQAALEENCAHLRVHG